ncbi:MAG: hypothetical protein NT062_05405 [Proteobacteria bacterium]|nr:hypothetical protein [Pseudomonadota bacterium]
MRVVLDEIDEQRAELRALRLAEVRARTIDHLIDRLARGQLAGRDIGGERVERVRPDAGDIADIADIADISDISYLREIVDGPFAAGSADATWAADGTHG